MPEGYVNLYDSGSKRQRNQLRKSMQDQNRTPEQIAAEMSRQWGFRPRQAWRHAYGWTQDEVAQQYNRLLDGGPDIMTAKRISDYENWPHGGVKPTLRVLSALANIYRTSASQLVDHSDCQALDPAERIALDAQPSTLTHVDSASDHDVVTRPPRGAVSNLAGRELIPAPPLANASIQEAKGRVFISYRRAEASHIAGRLYDWLTRKIGDQQVFMDVDSIELGVDFAEVVVGAIERCSILLAVIGHQWEAVVDKDGKQRLSRPDDLVRLEIETAIKRGIRIIPLLIDRAEMPNAQDLPPTMSALARRNALTIRHETFKEDMGRLLRAIERTLGLTD